jgi:CheY-like chemotaxis protein
VKRRLRLLIVEDDFDTAESLKLLLQLSGHEVRSFANGLAAIESAIESPPDMMLVDIGLPGIDGYEVARRVRRDGRLARVALVALTGYGREEDRRLAESAGFDHHLVKPIDPTSLGELLERCRPPGAA